MTPTATPAAIPTLLPTLPPTPSPTPPPAETKIPVIGEDTPLPPTNPPAPETPTPTAAPTFTPAPASTPEQPAKPTLILRRWKVFSRAYPSRRLNRKLEPGARARIPGIRLWPGDGAASPLMRLLGGD